MHTRERILHTFMRVEVSQGRTTRRRRNAWWTTEEGGGGEETSFAFSSYSNLLVRLLETDRDPKNRGVRRWT